MNHFIKFIVVIFLHKNISAQSGYFPYNINKSGKNTINVNSLAGLLNQDIKYSISPHFIPVSSESVNGDSSTNKFAPYCSCSLVNNAKQNKNAYVLLAAHCIDNDFISLAEGEDSESYMTFNYEMSDALSRGEISKDLSISTIYKVKYRVKMKVKEFDLALLELIEYDTKLLDYAYAGGLDNTLQLGKIRSMISHPNGDHKKIYPIDKEEESIFYSINNNIFTTSYRRGYLNRVKFNPVTPEGGCCGSLSLTANNLISGVYSGSSKNPNVSHISNSWYGIPELEQRTHLMPFLDPENTWLNQIPGGYFNDRVEINEEEFNLILGEKGTDSSVIETSWDDSFFNNSLLFDFVNYQRDVRSNQDHYIPIWTDVHGLKINNFNSSADINVVLSVWLQDGSDEIMLYGSYVNNQSPIINPDEVGLGPTELEFRGQGWDCDTPPSTDLPPCNRLFISNPISGQGQSTDTRSTMLKIFKKIASDNASLQGILDNNISINTKPIKIKLQNLGTVPVSIKAIRYPGDVPKNALQLFKPQEVAKKIKSYKYPESRLKGDDNFYIKSIKVSQGQYNKEIQTGNNGGYLNLVNPNYAIGPIKTSSDELTNSISVKINLHNPSNLNYSYKVWIDYFRVRNEETYTYNFVEDVVAISELIAEGVSPNSSSSQNEIFVENILMPRASEIDLGADQTLLTRMRISVVEGSITPSESLIDINKSGEVEDYLIELVEPNCENQKPLAYNTYAEDKLPYCGETGYKKIKESLINSYEIDQTNSDGSLKFQVGKLEDKSYATAWGSHYAFYGKKQNVNIWSPTGNNQTLRVNAIPEVNESQTIGAYPNFLKNHQLKMDIYYPITKNNVVSKALPVVIWVHGGGFMIHDKPEQSEKICQWLASKGYIVAAIDYRLGINLSNGELAKRAMIRAWQDMKAAVKYWRHANVRSFQNDSNQTVKLNIDTNKIYGLGWDAGAITVLNNMYLTEEIYKQEQADGKSLRSTAANYEFVVPTKIIVDDIIPRADALYNETNLEGIDSYILGSNLNSQIESDILSLVNIDNMYNLYNSLIDQETYYTFSLDDYPTLPCVGLHSDCSSNFTPESDYIEMINGLDDRVNKSLTFAGAMDKTWILKSELMRPVTNIHSEEDRVLNYLEGIPFQNNYLTQFNDLYNYPYNGPATNLSLTLDGGGYMKEDASRYQSINFDIITLNGTDKGGADNHTTMQKFGSTDNQDEIEDQLMYYVDAFFMKDTGTNSTPPATICETAITRPEYQEYQEYAEKILPYCGDGGYIEAKISLADSYEETEPGSLTFEVNEEIKDVPFATAWGKHYSFNGRKQNSNIQGLRNLIIPRPNESNRLGADVDFLELDQLKMDIYYPKPKVGIQATNLKDIPVIIHLFGGGFVKNDDDEMGPNMARWLASKGYLVVSIDYRLGITVHDGELAKRAIIRAWQDIEAAVKFWRFTDNDNATYQNKFDDGTHRWNIDTNKIYGIGHSAGGITVLNNIYLTRDKYNTEKNGFLQATTGDYEFTNTAQKASELISQMTQYYQSGLLGIFSGNIPSLKEINNIINLISTSVTDTPYKTYALDDYPTVPCIGVHSDCLTTLTQSDIISTNTIIDGYSLLGNLDRGLAFSGAILDNQWMIGNTTPVADIHHIEDSVVSIEDDEPFSTYGDLVNLYNIPITARMDKIFGGRTMDDMVASNPEINFNLTELTGSDKAGGAAGSYHRSTQKFGFTDRNALEPKLMYYVDAFFTKNWNIANQNKNIQKVEKNYNDTLPLPNIVKEEIKVPDFSVFPNPAKDELNILVEIQQRGSLKIEIFDLSGKKVYEMKEVNIAKGHQMISLNNLKIGSGSYVLKVQTGNVRKTEKVVFE